MHDQTWQNKLLSIILIKINIKVETHIIYCSYKYETSLKILPTSDGNNCFIAKTLIRIIKSDSVQESMTQSVMVDRKKKKESDNAVNIR